MADHPVGYWRLYETGGTVAGDFSGGNHPGTYSGDYKLADANSSYGRLASTLFNGSGQVTMSGGFPTGNKARTIELWYYESDGSNRTMLVYGAHGGGRLWEMVIVNNELSLHYWGNQILVGATSSPNCWHYGAITYDGNTTIQIFLDGIMVGQRTDIGLDTASDAFSLAGPAASALSSSWVGSLAEVAAYDYVLSPERIAAHYSTGLGLNAQADRIAPIDEYGLDVFSARPVAYWRLDERSGRVAADLGSGHQLGVYTGDNSFKLGVPGALTDEPANSAVSFNGSGQVAMCGRGLLPIGAHPRTVELWFKAADSANRALFAYGTSGGGRLWEVVQFAGSLGLHYWGNQVMSNGGVSLNEWHYLATTYDEKGAIQIYLDGRLNRTGNVPGLNTSWEYVRIGGPGFFPAWNGSLDEVAVYDYVLSPEVIARHYAIGTRPPAPSIWV